MSSAPDWNFEDISSLRFRPFIEYDWRQLRASLEDHADDALGLFAIMVECNARVSANPNSKARYVLEEARRRWIEVWLAQLAPEPEGGPGDGALGDTDWPEVGLLAHLGYRVGAKDPGQAARRTILAQTFNGPIPNVNNAGYMAEWGTDRSTQRLHKLAWSIATFANNRLRSNGGLWDGATETWAEDLAWLRSQASHLVESRIDWPRIDPHSR